MDSCTSHLDGEEDIQSDLSLKIAPIPAEVEEVSDIESLKEVSRTEELEESIPKSEEVCALQKYIYLEILIVVLCDIF